MHLHEAEPLLDVGHPAHLQSDGQAFMNLLRSFIGTGVLALPYAFKKSGLWSGFVTFVVIGLLCDFGMKKLLRCKAELEAQNVRTFETIGEYTLGKWGKWTTTFSVVTSQIGINVAYFIFVGENMHSVLDSFEIKEWMLIMLPVAVTLSMIPSMKWLAPVSMLGNFVLFAGLGVIYYYLLAHFSPGVRVERDLDVHSFPIFFGIAVYAFEGINLVLPIQDTMQNKHKFPLIMDLNMILIGAIFVTFGIVGYVQFGEDTHNIITLNMPPDLTSTIVKAAYCLVVVLSYPMAAWPIFEMSEREFILKPGVRLLEMKRRLMRMVIVFVTMVLAMSVPHFGLVLSLVGSFSNTLVSFVLPNLFYLKLFRGRIPTYDLVLCYASIVFGIIGGIIGTTVSLMEMVNQVRNPWKISN